MNLSAPPVLRPDELAESEPLLLSLLTGAFRSMYDALSRLPEPRTASGTFTSAASGVSWVAVKNPLPQKPQHITVSIRRDDLADFAAAWSWWHQMNGEQVVLKFIGLPASTKLVYSVGFI